MKKLILIAIIFLTGFTSVTVAHAQEAATSSGDSITETLKNLVKETAQKVQGAVTEQKTTFGLFGTLDKVVGSTVQIKSYTGPVRIAEVEKNAVITRLGKTITYEEIELNSPVIASGTLDQNGEYRIKTLRIVTDSIFPTKRQTLLGTFVSQTTKAVNSIAIGQQAGTPASVTITSKTAFLDILGQKIDKKTLKANQQILTVLPDGGTATASALRIYNLTLTPTSTKSATVAP